MITTDLPAVAAWLPGAEPSGFAPDSFLAAAARVREAVYVVREAPQGRLGVGFGGQLAPIAPGAPGLPAGSPPAAGASGLPAGSPPAAGASGLPVIGILPPLWPEWLGDRAFCEVHAVRFAYVGGEMANGIASTAMVVALAKAGMLGFFGAAGLSPTRIQESVAYLSEVLGTKYSWGANLIHSMHEASLEERTVDIFLANGVKRVSASAFMGLTPAIVRYAYTGLTLDADGQVVRPHHVFAKISRPETARAFMAPAPQALLDALVAKGGLTAEEARLAAVLPVAEDYTAESDSGGHTDNRPLGALFPIIRSLADELQAKHGYARPLRVGAAGGLGTPSSVAAAYAYGAAFVMTGSINQAALEAGQSEAAKQMLANCDFADVGMCPAGDMFELGVKVQVLKKGTMFAARAHKLYELYTTHPSLAAIAPDVRAKLETDVFQMTVDAVWQECVKYFTMRDPAQLVRAEKDPKHQMALVFRWYLGQSSRWAIAGIPERRLDYQIWAGPAQGAFNAWAKGSFLEPPEGRDVVQIGLNLIEGAAVVTRAHQLRTYGVALPPTAFDFRPRRLALA